MKETNKSRNKSKMAAVIAVLLCAFWLSEVRLRI